MVFKRDHIPWNKGKVGVQKHSKETREKISAVNRRRIISEETRIKLSNAKKGRRLSEETKRKISEVNKGKKLSEETRRKIGESNRGSHRSEETKQKMSKSQKQAYINNPELREMASRRHKGKIISVETRNKMSKFKKGKISSFKGKHHTEESKKMISDSHKKLHKCLSKEEKQKISVFHKGNKYCLGRKHPEEWKKQHSLFMKKYLRSNPKELNKNIKNLLNRKIQKPTKPQLKLFEIIKKLYLNNHVEQEWKVITKEGVRLIDVAIPSLMLGFEWDEPAYHGGFRGSKEKDIIRHNLIEAEGWKLTHYSKESELPKA